MQGRSVSADSLLLTDGSLGRLEDWLLGFVRWVECCGFRGLEPGVSGLCFGWALACRSFGARDAVTVPSRQFELHAATSVVSR